MPGEVPAWIRAAQATAGAAPAAAPTPVVCEGPRFGLLVLSGIAATAVVLFVRGKLNESSAEEQVEALLYEADRAQRQLDAEREDLSLAHDWTTAHPLALRYGE